MEKEVKKEEVMRPERSDAQISTRAVPKVFQNNQGQTTMQELGLPEPKFRKTDTERVNEAIMPPTQIPQPTPTHTLQHTLSQQPTSDQTTSNAALTQQEGILPAQQTPTPPSPFLSEQPTKEEQKKDIIVEAMPTITPSETQPEMQPDIDMVEEIAEEVVQEKMAEFSRKLESLDEFKRSAQERLQQLDSRIKRLEQMFDKLQLALLGKLQEYGRTAREVGARMEALETTLSKIISPLVENVKELSTIVQELKNMKS